MTFSKFDTTNADYTSRFVVDTSIDAPTEIYLNEEYWYTLAHNPYTFAVSMDGVDLDPKTDYVFEQVENFLRIFFTSEDFDNKEIEVRVTKNE